MEDAFSDFSELSSGDTSIALRRCFAQVAAERDQLRAERDAANTRAEAAEQKWDNLRQVVAQLCNDLPKNRDWLDPQIERVLRATAQIDYR